jgi:DNA modification methylase/predicted transcriptional regulator/uncharacterized ParB-like nuclease family protein
MTAVTQSLPLDAVKWDAAIYPRAKWSTATIERYADALEAGDEFPPIVVCADSGVLLDGKHRLEAHKKAGRETIAVERRQVHAGVPVKLFAASLSARHGDRMSNGDLRDVVRETYTTNPEFKQKDVAALLAVSPARVSEFASDILAKRREERRAKALRLTRLGWTQEQIAARLGVSQPTVNGDIKNFEPELLNSGHKPEEIALRLGVPVQIVLAQQFDGAPDEERMKALGIKVQPYDVWQFPGCHDLMGDRHPGRIPGELLCHVLYFFTKPGDLVVDPMAGSGTTLDACLLMGRKARGYDIDARHERTDIEAHDLSTGWPDTVTKAALVFWDPPYFDKMDHASIGDDGYIEGSISGLDPDEYLAWFADRFAELHKQVKPGTRFAFLMSDWDPENAKRHQGHAGIFVWDYADRLRDAGWTLRRHIQVPLSTQQVHPDIVNKFRASRRLARLERYLLVAEA